MCIIVISDAAPDRGVKYRHAWNIVKLDGRFYHLDATFDGSLSHDGVIRRDYLDLDDSRLFRDHQPLLYPAPACTDPGAFFYRAQKLSFTRVEDVVKWAGMSIRKDLPFVFHWRGGPLTREVLAELTAALEAAAQSRGRHAAVSFNYPQAVLQVRFPKELPSAAPIQEEANEGEALGDLPHEKVPRSQMAAGDFARYVAPPSFKDRPGDIQLPAAAVIDVYAVAGKKAVREPQAGIRRDTLQQNGGPVAAEGIAAVGSVRHSGARRIEVEADLIVLEHTVRGVDPGGPIGQQAGPPAGDLTVGQMDAGRGGDACTSLSAVPILQPIEIADVP